jgi:glycerol-3-phosphate dehydrogenase (NAD(P)+)
MAGAARVAVLGAGAMGTALAWHTAALGAPTVLLATDHDAAALDAWRRGAPHPALRVPFSSLRVLPPEQWDVGLGAADHVLVAVSSAGLEPVLTRARDLTSPELWLLVTKGWEAGSLRRPSEVARAVLGSAPLASLAGPALAAEMVAGAPTGLLVAAEDHEVRRRAVDVLSAATTAVFTSSDVVGTETASAFKNVVAVAVGLAEGLAKRFTAAGVGHVFANARAALFARGVLDMAALVESQGGRVTTVLGLAGTGDLYVTCAQGRNGRFGRLLGDGATVEAAMRTIGSTVEGAANTVAALALAEHAGIDLPSARVVERALGAEFADGGAPERLRGVFMAALGLDIPGSPVPALVPD